jgi:nucleoside-diphosphate-sugar epimerase
VVYGPRDTDVFEIFRTAVRGVYLRIGRQESYVSVIYVKDLVEALLAAACSPRAPGRTYFVANEAPVSWAAFSASIAEAVAHPLHTISIPFQAAWVLAWLAELHSRLRGKPGIVSREKMKEGRCRYWVCDVSRARQDLGFLPSTPLSEGIAQTLAWYKWAGWLKP